MSGHTGSAGARILPAMSRRVPVKAKAGQEERAPDMSAEAAVDREIAKVAAWLAAQPLTAAAAVPEGQRDGYYWRSGYFAGLKRALAMLSSRGATLH